MPKEAKEAKPKETKARAAKAPKKEQKDPNAPKRALTSFMYFCNEKRDEIRAANPEMKMTEISKLLGAKWKELSEEDKKPYTELNAKDKARYEKEKASYDKSGGKSD